MFSEELQNKKQPANTVLPLAQSSGKVNFKGKGRPQIPRTLRTTKGRDVVLSTKVSKQTLTNMVFYSPLSQINVNHDNID